MLSLVYSRTGTSASRRLMSCGVLCCLSLLCGLWGCEGRSTAPAPANPLPPPTSLPATASAPLPTLGRTASQPTPSPAKLTDAAAPAGTASTAGARFVVQHPWIGKGVWLKVDTHIHTKFSDGAVELEEILRQGAAHGCDVMAITDHADRELSAATEIYFTRLQAARRTFPETLVIAGLEWNVPPWSGREHAVVLIDDRVEESVLPEFKLLFDDWKRPETKPELPVDALRWLAEQTRATGGAVVFYNHPNRKRELQENFVDELTRLRAVNNLVVGFEGAPGHQLAPSIGAYQATQVTVDRWDPAASTVDGEWDQLLAKGEMLWGAYAASDFHSRASNDDCYWPGEFSETWLYAPERSIAGALQALRAGSFFALHGYIAREVVLNVQAPGLPRAAVAGETIEVALESEITISLTAAVPDRDWQGQPNTIDEVEFIIVHADATRSVRKQPLNPSGPLLETSLVVPRTGLVVRARGRRTMKGEPDLMFYTNPIRITVSQRGA